MGDDRFQIIMRTFERALELDPGARQEFVAREVGYDPEVRAEVSALLLHHDAQGSAVATGVGLEAVGRSGGVSNLSADGFALPVLTGNYRILRTIGEGGMGIVFEAEQSFPRRRVALKAVRPGMASRGILRRFRNEVDLLGRLQHPGIAQLYEAGIADELSPDQAFFAMELIDGCSLTEFAREHGCDQPTRWRLILRVCEAVQHAHQRGVIHRDLKPGNILVGKDGLPKVVDFGIARAAEESNHHSLATRTGQIVGTPSYMSPEQIRGGEVDTRSDVYALGVIAYELLAGRLPFDLSGVGLIEAARIIREDEPTSASSFDSALRGDAEVIIRKAMAKEPDRRYSSAGELAADIRRFLAGDAIAARRDSALYLLRKQMRRHRTAAWIIAIGLASLVGFTVYASVNARRQTKLAIAANSARDRERSAKEEAQKATAEAQAARAAAEAELAQSTIERGRLEAAGNNLPLAEDILWRAYFNSPDSLSARWGLWELYDRIPSRWAVQAAGVHSLATASGDGRYIAWQSGAGRAVVYDARTGELKFAHTFTGGALTALAISFDGSLLLVSPSRGESLLVPVFDPGAWLMLPQAVGVRAAAFTRDGATLATVGADRMVRVWQTGSGELERSWEAAGTPRVLAISGDGSMVAVGGEGPATDGVLQVWSPTSGEPLGDPSGSMPSPVTMLAFLTGSDRLTIALRNGTTHFREPDGRVIRSNLATASGITCIAPAPDERRVLIATEDRAFLVDSMLGESARPLARQRWSVAAAAWQRDGDLTTLTRDGLLRRVGPGTNVSAARITGFGGWLFSVLYSPRGDRLAVGTGVGEVDVFEVPTQQPAARCVISTNAFRIRQLAYVNGGASLLAGCQDGQVRRINPENGEIERTIPGEKSEVYAMAVSPDESVVAVGYQNRIVRLIDLRTGELILAMPPFEKRIEGLAYSPDGRTLAISCYLKGIALWDVAGRSVSRKLETTAQPWCVAFASDGSQLLVGTQAGTLEAFSTADWSRTWVLRGHQRLIPALAISPDGNLFATGGEDSLVRLWDVRTMRTLASFDTEGLAIVTLAFSPDSKRLAGAAANRFVIEYDLTASDAAIKAHEPYMRTRLLPR